VNGPLTTRLISSWPVLSRYDPKSISKPLILEIYQIDYDFAHCTRVECSEYLCRRSIPSFAFSNPFRIPEISKLKRSSGSMNFIKRKRTSTLSDDTSMIDTLTSLWCTNETSIKLLMIVVSFKFYSLPGATCLNVPVELSGPMSGAVQTVVDNIISLCRKQFNEH